MISSWREWIQPRHPEDQEPHSLGAHRGDMVASLVINLGVRRATTSREDASRSCRPTFGTRPPDCASPLVGVTRLTVRVAASVVRVSARAVLFSRWGYRESAYPRAEADHDEDTIELKS